MAGYNTIPGRHIFCFSSCSHFPVVPHTDKITVCLPFVLGLPTTHFLSLLRLRALPKCYESHDHSDTVLQGTLNGTKSWTGSLCKHTGTYIHDEPGRTFSTERKALARGLTYIKHTPGPTCRMALRTNVCISTVSIARISEHADAYASSCWSHKTLQSTKWVSHIHEDEDDVDQMNLSISAFI